MKGLRKMLLAGVASVVLALALILFGSLELSRQRLPEGIAGLLATHWQAGQPADCRLCPERLFVVICDADRQVYLRNLQQLATLQAEFLKDGQRADMPTNHAYSCIGNRNFRLSRPSGRFGGPYDPADPEFRQDVSFQVLREAAGSQVVEVRYKDSRTDIDDALFRYEVLNGAVRPLESWVLTRGHFAALVGSVIASVFLLFLCGLLYLGMTALWHRIFSRGHHP